MNYRRIGKVVLCALVCALVFTTWNSAAASPLVLISLEGRRAGKGADRWRNVIDNVSVSDVIEYRVIIDMAPVGTRNTQRDPSTGQFTTTTITSLTPGQDGMNSLYLALRQSASTPIQVNFTRGGPIIDPDSGELIDSQMFFLVSGWRQGGGVFGGRLESRAGTPYQDLVAIRPARDGGSFFGIDRTPVLTPPTPNPNMLGRFIVESVNGLQGTVDVTWGGSTSGGGRVNSDDGGREIIVNDVTQAYSDDPFVGFSPLVISAIPEPSSIVLSGIGALSLLIFAYWRRNSNTV